MRLLVWNIRNGGGARVDEIIRRIDHHAPDTVVLTEFRESRLGDCIRRGLARIGLPSQHAGSGSPTLNSVLLASRYPLVPRASDGLAQELAHRVVQVHCQDLTIAGVYFPQKQAKVPLFEHFLEQSAGLLAGRSILCGDFNTGMHHVDEEGATFVAAGEFERLTRQGWTDAWRHLHGGEREFTWYSHAGNGFRIDHVFLSLGLVPELIRADYSHEERRQGVSDHSAAIVEFDDRLV